MISLPRLNADRLRQALAQLVRLADRQPPQARLLAAFVGRLAGDELLVAIEVAQTTAGPLGAVLADVFDNVSRKDEVIALHAAMPDETIALADAAVVIAETLCAQHRERAEAGDAEASLRLAGWLADLANRLAAVGRKDRALQTAEGAVALLRHRGNDRSPQVAARFANALTSLGGRLADLGRYREALGACRT